MNHPKMSVLESFFKNDTTKSVGLGALLSVAGWAAHALIGAENNATVLANHTKQLDAQSAAITQTADSVQHLTVAVTRIDGKIDVLTTKIDDDRHRPSIVARAHPPHEDAVAADSSGIALK